ncbi:hypothetical protein CLU79DRAFT_296258 [Phycomyces nitens]|nr:hypothetical protein CLU79DRAFT_296258 [Phycomyces nitens]
MDYEKPTTLKPSVHFRPYQASFLNITSTPEDVLGSPDKITKTDGSPIQTKRISVAPVYYEDGKFYCDDLVGDYARKDRPAMAIPEYDRLDIDPLGSESFKYIGFSTKPFSGKSCWNCGSEYHELSKCPEQRNNEKIRKSQTLYRETHGTFGRFHMELTEYNKLSSLKPGKLSNSLQEALGIKGTSDEPQYYHKMRIYGYPPGYKGTAPKKGISQLPISKESVQFESTPLLNIYDDDYEEEEEEEEEESQEGDMSISNDINGPETDKSEELVELVVYPGLDIKEKPNTQPPWSSSISNFYPMEPNNNHYYQQFQDQPPQEAYPMSLSCCAYRPTTTPDCSTAKYRGSHIKR